MTAGKIYTLHTGSQ